MSLFYYFYGFSDLCELDAWHNRCFLNEAQVLINNDPYVLCKDIENFYRSYFFTQINLRIQKKKKQKTKKTIPVNSKNKTRISRHV